MPPLDGDRVEGLVRLLKNTMQMNYNPTPPKMPTTTPKPEVKKVRKIEFGEQRQKNDKKASSSVTFQDLSNYAISILMKARTCPLVGNHASIVLSLGRMIVSSYAVGNTVGGGGATIDLSRKGLCDRIQVAIDACWDSMDMCHDEQRYKAKRFSVDQTSAQKALKAFSDVDIKYRKLIHEKRVPKLTLQQSMEATIELPQSFFDSEIGLEKRDQIFGDRNMVRSLCGELNRWSQLKEELVDGNMDRSVKLSRSNNRCLSFGAEELPLFACMETGPSPMDVHVLNSEDETAMVLWEW
jgi:hypothetical protein